jgi:hypothetical protein
VENTSINLANYGHGAGFGDDALSQAPQSAEAVHELSKALEAGSITGRETTDLTTASGAPLKVESLEKNLKVLTFSEADIKLWKRIPKSPAFNTVEEYLQLDSYGADRGGFNNEGELPEEEDATYIRKAELVKFLGVTKSVTHPMTLVKNYIGDAVQREVTNGIQWILRKADKGLFRADSNIVSQEWNGLYTQHRVNGSYANLDAYQKNNALVVDMRGKRLSEDAIESGCLEIIRNFGYANLLVGPPSVLSNFVKNFHDKKLINPSSIQVTAGVMGQRVNSFASQFGEIELDYDIFGQKAAPKKIGDSASANKAPAAPVSVGATTPANVLGQFVAADAGDYIYAVTAKNRYGESAPTQITGGAITVAAGDSVDLEYTAGAGTYAATGYVIYRTKVDDTAASSLLYPLFEVSVAELAAGYDGGAAGHVFDNNRWLPDTEEAMLLQSDKQIYEFKQLAPLMKMPLAQLSPAERFMVLLYGTPILYQPQKMVRFINVGTAA